MVDETTLTQEQLLELHRTEAEEAQELLLQLVAKLRRLELRHPGLELVDVVIGDSRVLYDYVDELRGESDEGDEEEDTED